MDIKKITEKISFPMAIVIAAVVLTIGFYAVQYNKQQSIERQQALELQEQRAIEKAKAEQAQKEYIAKRKMDCLGIYKVESSKWNNVLGWRYSETDDQCFIIYKDQNPKSDAECDKLYPTEGEWGLIFGRVNWLCKQGEFENSF